MKKRKLGKNGPLVSPIGIGAMSFTNFYGPTDERASHAILKMALDNDINHLDTANVYGMGHSESVIGDFLIKQGKQKKDLFTIASKASVTKDSVSGKRIFDNSREHLERELNGTLKRLGLDHIEMLYIHRRDTNFSIEEVTDTLCEFIKMGKIARFGFSEISPASLLRASKVHEVAAVQSEYSLSVRSPELGLVQAARELGTSLVAFSPVGRGLLTDAPPFPAKIDKIGFLRENPRFQEPNLSANNLIVQKLRSFSKEKGVSTAAVAIAWLLHRDEHIIPIPGTRSISHFKELVAGASLALSSEDITTIENLLPLGWAHGDRYSVDQWVGPERYC